MTYHQIPVGEAAELPGEDGWREWDRAVRAVNGESAGIPPRWLVPGDVPPPHKLYLEQWLDTVKDKLL